MRQVIRRELALRGWSTERLAVEMAASASTVGNLLSENSKRSPSERKFHRALEVLGYQVIQVLKKAS